MITSVSVAFTTARLWLRCAGYAVMLMLQSVNNMVTAPAKTGSVLVVMKEDYSERDS